MIVLNKMIVNLFKANSHSDVTSRHALYLLMIISKHPQ